MVRMRFHWEFEGETGSFEVESFTIEKCIEIAKQEINEHGCDLIDYYEI